MVYQWPAVRHADPFPVGCWHGTCTDRGLESQTQGSYMTIQRNNHNVIVCFVLFVLFLACVASPAWNFFFGGGEFFGFQKAEIAQSYWSVSLVYVCGSEFAGM